MIVAALSFGVLAIVANTTSVPLLEWLALAPGAATFTYLWQVVTYVVVEPPDQSSLLWIVVSLVFVWLVVSPFEMRHGPRRTWLGMLLMTLAGGVGALAAGLVAHQLGFRGGVLYGLGAPTYGMLVAGVFGSGAPVVNLFGRLPLKRAQVAWLLGVFSLFQFAAFSHDAAMLGGDLAAIGVGVLYGQWLLRPVRPSRAKPRRASHLRAIQGGRTDDDDGDGEEQKPRWLN